MNEYATSALQDARAQARNEALRADQKATTLLSMIGFVLSAVVVFSQRPLALAAAVVLWLAAAPLAYALVRLLLTIRPRLATEPVPGSWIDAALNGSDGLVKLATSDLTEEHVVRQQCREITQVAVIAHIKHTSIRRAVPAILIGLALLCTAVILNATL